ncbi:anti-sigma factor [Streptomyces sp. NBC_01460]|uniref:anti-sigma factor n=1 Tax=Streptomyces sp. NBC_01460 TaxID=2903875 RepID=UPI002E2F511F|nr:anti-sigma factor [Streptomyces sp. NBC_01460]
MSAADPHESSGAYVLHALPDGERRAFEAHLAECGQCQEEVAELRATTALLGQLTAEHPPESLRDQVLRKVADTPQEPRPHAQEAQPHTQEARPHPTAKVPGRRRPARSLILALAASVAVALVCLGLAGWQHQEASDAKDHADRVEAQAHEVQAQAHQVEAEQKNVTKVLTASDVRLQTQVLSDGATASVTFSRSEGSATLAVSGLPALPAGRTYAAWFMEDGTPVPAGLLSGDPGRQVTLLEGTLDDATAVALSVEPDGGSPQPTTVPLGAVPLTA